MWRARTLLLAAGAVGLLAVTFGVASAAGTLSPTGTLSPNERLGKAIFFDENLSLNRNTACASCHGAAVGFTGPISEINQHGAVYEGSVAGAFGNRKPPSNAYTTMSPILHVDKTGAWVGGNFWDGRATGEKLGNPAADQAQGPFLNPKEQALPDSACVVYRVFTGGYGADFEAVWGAGSRSITWPSPSDVEASCSVPNGTVTLSTQDRAKADVSYDRIALSIAAYEASAEVNTFSSKYDAASKGEAKLTALEQRGLTLFEGKAGCTACHPLLPTGDALFTDFTYDNLGTPQNPENPAVLRDPTYVDYGLGGYLKGAGYPAAVYEPEMGKVKVPTLRNVDLRPSAGFVKAYGANGYFKSLEAIVHFYNTRDVLARCPGPYTEAEALKANCWPAPEVAANVNTVQLGNLGLSPSDEAAIVAYLKTLSDGYGPTTIDRTAPSVTAPAATLRTGVSLSGTAIPLRLAWTGTDGGGSGIARYELARSTDGGTWMTVSSSLTAPYADVPVPSSGTVRFRVRAVDRAANTGAWATGQTLTPRLFEQSSTSVTYAGTWNTTTGTAYSGGSATYAKAAGASASYTFTGRSIALVTTKAPTRGTVKVYVNGTYVATVDLYATTTKYRALAWQKTWSTSGTRTVKLVVVGTSGRPRVDLDAFAVLK
jgi:cytochrome c peroxidase